MRVYLPVGQDAAILQTRRGIEVRSPELDRSPVLLPGAEVERGEGELRIPLADASLLHSSAEGEGTLTIRFSPSGPPLPGSPAATMTLESEAPTLDLEPETGRTALEPSDDGDQVLIYGPDGKVQAALPGELVTVHDPARGMTLTARVPTKDGETSWIQVAGNRYLLRLEVVR